MSIGFTVIVGDALFFSVPEGELYFLVNKFKSKKGVHIQVLFHPNESLIRGVIETFFIKHSDLPISYQRLVKTPISLLQHFLFEKSEAKAFKGQTIRCPWILETSVGNFQPFYLEEAVEREKFSLCELRRYFKTDEISQNRKSILNDQKIPKAE